jgi:hypothetical protein
MSNFAAQNCILLLETLISSKTRVKLLLKFFLNSNTTAYLRGLESEFGESTNAIRLELNRFEDAGMIMSHADGNKKVFTANTNHPLFHEIHNILLKYIGFDKIIETVIERLGEVRTVFVTGDFAQGRDSRVIDLVFVGDDIDRNYLIQLIEKAENLIQRKIRFLIYASDEFNSDQLRQQHASALLLWSHIK